jgi:threonine dehydrogenase-like Zn-dependent dehydrogenase
VYERSLPHLAAARVAGALAPGRGARVGPLRLEEVDPPALPGPGWVRVRPRLAGICGSDLATVDGRASRYFEPFVSFPFTPGHEVVGSRADGTRVVLEPVLRCQARGVDPPCRQCASGATQRCERVAVGGVVEAGLQTGYCADTGGGWSRELVAHESQLHDVPDDLSDEAAVLVEPAACALHAALTVTADEVAVLGTGTLGLCTVAALHSAVPRRPQLVLATAKHPEQRALAAELGADEVVAPDELPRAVRRATRSLVAGRQLTGGMGAVVDCVGSEASLASALDVVAPGGTVVLLGMPGRVSVDLTSLWHREVRLTGSYAYGQEAGGRIFALAFDLVREAGLERLLSATYPLDRYEEALAHAAEAGRRGAVKIAFDLRGERR